MTEFNGIINVKRQISKAINMDVMFITDCYIEHDEVIFTVMENERFVAEWKNDTVTPSTVQHIKSLEPLEDIPF